MAITKEAVVEKIEVVGTWNVQVAIDTVIKEDGTEISRSRNRHVLQPFSSNYKTENVDGLAIPILDSDGKKQWTHTDTDISSETTEVQAVANAVWTDTVKANYKTFRESQEV
jgi:hypothetical protein